MSTDVLWPLVGGLGTLAGALAAWITWWPGHKQRKLAQWLIQDEIIGHKNLPGVPDKPPISHRLGALEIGMQSLQRELHPNGGASLADRVNATAESTKHIANVVQAREAERRTQDALVRGIVQANPDKFQELYDILKMLPEPRD